MKRLFVALLLLALPTRSSSQPPPPQAPRPLVFTHVTIIDATGAPVQPDRTVVTRRSRTVADGLLFVPSLCQAGSE